MTDQAENTDHVEEAEETKPHIDLYVTINDEKIIAERPKFGLLKKVMRANEQWRNNPETFETVDGIDIIYQLLVDIFNTDKLTMENIEDVDLESFFSLEIINEWIGQYVPQKKMMEAQQLERMKSNRKTQGKA